MPRSKRTRLTVGLTPALLERFNRVYEETPLHTMPRSQALAVVVSHGIAEIERRYARTEEPPQDDPRILDFWRM